MSDSDREPPTVRSRGAWCEQCGLREMQLLLADSLARAIKPFVDGLRGSGSDLDRVHVANIFNAFDAYSEARINSEIARGVE